MPDELDLGMLIKDLQRDEGFESHPYLDTVGKLTIGYGRNLTDEGITKKEGAYLLRNDIKKHNKDLDRNLPWWRKMDKKAQRALANMSFNLGWPRLSRFKRMLRSLKGKEYMKAKMEALNSVWARQVKGRALRIAELFRRANEEKVDEC